MNKTKIKLIALAVISGIVLAGTPYFAKAIAMDKKITTGKIMSAEEEKTFSTDHLTPLQKKVTIEGGTEKPFKNEYWDNKAEGIYVDVINGDPLFSSTNKYKSGTGWPSFTKPIKLAAVSEHADNGLFTKRTEIKSSSTNAHLGHVFPDGPKDQGGMRYCMNSASMRFVAKDALEKEGYGEYLNLFE
jgi:peptide methionine sulfoxide reductase msrA/msrB